MPEFPDLEMSMILELPLQACVGITVWCPLALPEKPEQPGLLVRPYLNKQSKMITFKDFFCFVWFSFVFVTGELEEGYFQSQPGLRSSLQGG